MARIWRFGTDVNTDQIVPGRYAPYMTSEEELRKYPFIEARPEFPEEVRPGDVIVAGANFGCGSSREYAPLSLKMVKIGAIIAPLFARIFYRNAMNLGLPLFELDLQQIADGTPCELDLDRCVMQVGGDEIHLPAPPEFVREIWRAGGVIPYYLKHGRFPGESAA